MHNGKARLMKTVHVILLTAFAAGLAAVTPAIGQEENIATESNAATNGSEPLEGGPLRTMPHGTYQCARPGDAGGAAFEVDEDQSFRIFTASRYESGDGAGTYIMRGTSLTFTRGPRNGERFERIGNNQLRKLAADGTRSNLLCTRLGSR